MPCGFIVLIAAIALSGVFVFGAEASWWWKLVAAGLLLLSFVWRYGALLQAALGVSPSLYFARLKPDAALAQGFGLTNRTEFV
jgi:hypothetical protein